MAYDFDLLLLPAFNALLDFAEKRGWVTHQELDGVLPSDLDADGVEDIYSIANARGIQVIDDESTN